MLATSRVALGARTATTTRCVSPGRPRPRARLARRTVPFASSPFFSNAILTEIVRVPSPTPHSGDAQPARGSAQVRGARLAPRAAPRARRVSVAARANLNTHTVASGENLWAISVARGVTLQELKAANAKALGRSDTIYPGQQLIVPPGGKRLASVPSGYKPSAGTGVGAYKSASAGALRSSVNPANLAKKQGLGLVTAGAFFIALAAGIWMFKEEEPAPGAYGAGAYDQRDAYGGQNGYDQGGYDQQGGYANGNNGGYYDQYNRGDWNAPSYGNGDNVNDGRTPPRGGDYSGPPQWGEDQRYDQRY